MILIGLAAVWAFEIPSPHPIDQFEPDVRQSENDDTSDRGCDRRVHVHYEDEIMNIYQFRRLTL
jgi:hypothetical protein